MIKTISAPRINTNDDQLQVVKWYFEDDTYVEAGEDLADLETSKALVTVTAEAAGFLRQLVRKGAIVRVGSPLYCLATEAGELSAAGIPAAAPGLPPGRKPAELPAAAGITARGAYSTTRFSKAALRLMQERGIAPGAFSHAGLVTARSLDDQPAAPVRRRTGVPANPAGGPGPQVPPGPETPRQDAVTLSKQAEIQSLAIGEAGNVNSMLAVDFDSAGIRARLLRDRAFDGSIQPVLLFELSRLLKGWPEFTAYYEDGACHFYDRIDLGVAFDLGRGLKVVTIPDSDRLMPIDFFERTTDIGIRYLENRLRLEELGGSTFTVTDLSGLDVAHFHPIINGHQSAILGIGGDSGRPGHPMSLCLTFDHRVSNGLAVATFLNQLKARLLSYAMAPEPAGPALAGGDAGATGIQCDTCGVDAASYYGDYERDGYLIPYYRRDGTVGSVCHRCYSGL